MRMRHFSLLLLAVLMAAAQVQSANGEEPAADELAQLMSEFPAKERIPESTQQRMRVLIEEIAAQGPAADAAVPHLIAVFKRCWPLRNDAAVAIGKVTAKPLEVFPGLIVFGYEGSGTSKVQVSDWDCIYGAGRHLSDQTVLQLLHHEDWRVRCWAVRQVGQRIEDKEGETYASARERMQSTLNRIRDYREREERFRNGVADALTKAAGHLTEPLARMLDDPDADVRAFAIVSLSRSRIAQEPLLPCLLRLLKDEGVLRHRRDVCWSEYFLSGRSVRETAISAAGQMSYPPAVADLLAAGMKDPNAKVREGCVRSLEHRIWTSQWLPVLEAALQDEDDRVFRAAVWLARGKTPSPAVISALTAALEQESRRQKAAEALAGFGSASAPAVPLLTQSLERGSCQQEVIRCLGRIGVAAEPALPAIKAQLNSIDPRLRILAARAVWNITQQPDDVMLVFMELLPDGANRAQVCEGLGEMKSAAAPAVGPLVELLSANGKDVRIMRTLGEIGPAAKAALPVLDSVAEHAQSPYSTRAKEAASRIRGEAAK